MSRVIMFLAILVGFFSPRSVSAGGPSSRSFGVRTDYTFVGRAQRPTGGLMPFAEGSYAWILGEAVELRLGAEIGLSVDATRWMAILGGPTLALGGPLGRLPVELLGTLHIDSGRMPTVNGWGFPLNYSGLFPAGSLAAIYSPGGPAVAGFFGEGRIVNTYSTGNSVSFGFGVWGQVNL